MKKEIHPNFQNTVFRCACGAEIETRSLQSEYKLEICSACHPFFTGRQKLVDTAGRVERFMKKFGDKAIASGQKPAKMTKKVAKPPKIEKGQKPAKAEKGEGAKPKAPKEKPAKDKAGKAKSDKSK